MTYEDMDYYTRVFNLIFNRVGIINQILGCRYDFDASNPCVVRHVGHEWRVDYYGSCVASWHIWDLPGIESAFARVDALDDALWITRRVGMLCRPVYAGAQRDTQENITSAACV